MNPSLPVLPNQFWLRNCDLSIGDYLLQYTKRVKGKYFLLFFKKIG
jgi:hypothetical protein